MNKLEIKALAPKDHFHFSNQCDLCKKVVEDSSIVAVYLNDLTEFCLYIKGYACKRCAKLED